ncbi:MAG: hypothetical protein O7G84_00445, partial [Gammaproteobacteria bacterium]|nr:hypothetical protein [Gammaproteobacteria bacterium]
RDELRVQIHLATMEAKDEWEELEKKWQQLEPRLAQAKDGIVETSRTVGAGLEVVAEELGAAYRRIRERLTGS